MDPKNASLPLEKVLDKEDSFGEIGKTFSLEPLDPELLTELGDSFLPEAEDPKMTTLECLGVIFVESGQDRGEELLDPNVGVSIRFSGSLLVDLTETGAAAAFLLPGVPVDGVVSIRKLGPTLVLPTFFTGVDTAFSKYAGALDFKD